MKTIPAAVLNGTIYWWRLTADAPVRLADLTSHWQGAYLPEDELPKAPTPICALARAVKHQVGKRRFVRALPGRAGWLIIDEHQVSADCYDAAVRLVVRLGSTPEGGGAPPLVFETPYKEGVIDSFRDALLRAGQMLEDGHEQVSMEAEIRSSYRFHLGHLSHQDISSWLVKRIEALDAIPLRDTGGIYFLPEYAEPAWNQRTRCLIACSKHQVLTVPTFTCEQTVSSILDSLTRDAEAWTELTFKSLEADENGKLPGKRALANRAASCEEYAGKLSRYEGLLGVQLDALREKLSGLEAAISAASLVATMDDEEQAA